MNYMRRAYEALSWTIDGYCYTIDIHQRPTIRSRSTLTLGYPRGQADGRRLTPSCQTETRFGHFAGSPTQSRFAECLSWYLHYNNNIYWNVIISDLKH